MSSADLKYWLHLNKISGLSFAKTNRLLANFGSAEAIVNASLNQLECFGISELTIQTIKSPDWEALEKECRWGEEPNHTILTINHPHYPHLLKHITDPPLILYVWGEVGLLNQLQLAIVGSRNPSPAGVETAQQFSYEIAKGGVVVTSGLALGIDAACHQGAISAAGKTLAVLGCGLNNLYPWAHKKLAAEILSTGGALISEFSLDTAPRAIHFPMRNRIISGLSLGTLVIEATLRSGSLITARLAAEQGREVFAIPGSINNPLVRGCHLLIRNGAKLTESVADIMEELGPLAEIALNHLDNDRQAIQNKSAQKSQSHTKLDQSLVNLLDCMGFEMVTMDQLINRSGKKSAEISAMMLILELQGYVNTVNNGNYIRVKL